MQLAKSTKETYPLSWTTLPKELLFYISTLLDFETLFRLKELSPAYKLKMDNILRQMVFWNYFPELNITSEINAVSIGNGGFKNFISHTAKMADKKVNTAYFIRRDTSFWWWQKENIAYRYMGCSWDLEPIHALILTDQASTLLQKVTQFGYLIPYIQGDMFDLQSIRNHLDYPWFGELGFIGLIPPAHSL